MRIKKKQLLEALDANKTTKTSTADKEKGLEIATNLGREGASAKKEIVNTLGNTPKSIEIADELVGAALKNEAKEEELKPKKKKVKEVVKVKNLKK